MEKPDILDYNTAFHHLTHGLQKKGLKHLICPPIGCVREKVQLTTFILNLKKFQTVTKAKVTIVSYGQKSFEKMRNGLSHDEFNRETKRFIGIKNITENRTAVCSRTIPAQTPTTPPSTSRHDDRCADVQTRVMTHDTYADAVVSRSPSNSSDQLNSHSPKNFLISEIIIQAR